MPADGSHPSPAYSRALALVGGGAISRAVARLVITGAAFATTALVVRQLGPISFGALAFGLSIVGLSSAITSGFGVAATRTIAGHVAHGDRESAGLVTRGLTNVVVVGGGGSLLLLLLIIWVTQEQLETGETLVLGLGLGMLLVGHSAVIAGGAVARGFGRVVLMETPGLVEVVSKLLLVMLLLGLGMATLGAVAGVYGVAGLAAGLAAAAIAHRAHAGVDHLFRPAAAAAVQLLRITAPYAVAVVAYRLIQSFDVAVLGATHPVGAVGSYAPTLVLVESLVMLVPLLFSAVFVTASTALAETGDTAAFSRLYLTVSRLSMLAAMPAFILLTVAPDEVLTFAFGEGFPAAATVVRILLLGFFVTVVFGLNGQALVASGERRRLARAFAWPGATMVVSSLVLIPLFGGIGAAAATALSLLALNLSLSWVLYRTTGTHPLHRALVILVVTAPVAVLGGGGLHDAVGDGFWSAVLASVAAWAVWIAVAWILGAFRFKEFRGLLPKRTMPVLTEDGS